MFYGTRFDLARRCGGLSGFRAAFDVLARLEDPSSPEHKLLTSLNVGEVKKVEIRGKQLFAVHQCYMSKPRNEARLEAHRRYIDIQYVLSGKEIMMFDCTAGLKPTEAYSAEKDVEFLAPANPVDIPLTKGTVAVLFPEDAHAPGIQANGAEKIFKCVLKLEIAN